ncbi:uncharacterized protein l(1)10Bb isoform X10 [Dermacentor andersoni]|uniref:uncharacterized protein l(1)10Bb isoform X10 n=1 Tax=Dermacentor andersoni TaxID=34620 RepID=UPI003B3AA37C
MSLAESIARLMVCHTPSEAIGQVEVGTQCSFPLADKSVGCCFRAGSESRSVQTTEAVDQSSYPSEAQRMFIAMIKGSSLPATLVVIDALATRESIDENPDASRPSISPSTASGDNSQQGRLRQDHLCDYEAGLTAAFVRCSAAALGTCCSSLNHLGSQGTCYWVRQSHTKASARWSLCGPSSRSTTRSPDTCLTSSTSGRPSAKSFTSTASGRALLTAT